MAYCDEGNQEIPNDHRREVLAAEDIEAEDLVYLKPDGTVGLSYGTKRRRERYGMLWKDLFREEMEAPIVPGSPSFEAMRAWLKSYNEMVRRMTGAFREPAPEPPRAEDAAETEGLSSDGLTWRQKPGLL